MTVSEAASRPDASSAPRRLVVAATGSATSLGAGLWAKRIAPAIGASITVVDACDRDDRPTHLVDADDIVAVVESRLSEHLDANEIRVDDLVVEHGDPASVILRHTGDDVAMIVIGANAADGWHRRSHRDLLVELARGASCPIVAVPPGDWLTDGSVMVGIDGSDANEAVFRWARWIAGALDWPTIAVHVSDPLYRTFSSFERLSPEDIDVRHEIERSEVEFVERVDADTEGSLSDYAEIRRASLLVVGARVHHSVGGRLLGGVALGVVEHASCPVAVLPRRYQLEHV